MKTYYTYTDEKGIECFYELNTELYCERAVFKTPHKITNTFLEIEQESYFLPEGSLKDSLPFMKPTSKIEFNIIWQKSMKGVEEDWLVLKSKYRIGTKIKSKILCIYPQGVVLDFGEKFYALSSYESCLKKIGKEKIYPKNELELTISAFNDTNKIVELSLPEKQKAHSK